VVLVLLVVVFSLRGPALVALGEWLVVEDQFGPADLMVVLGGSPVVRSLAAADYYRQGQAPLIFVSRGDLVRHELVEDVDLTEAGEWGVIYRLLKARGVPPENIIIDTVYVNNTMEEARRVKTFIKGRGVKNLILVTSRYHSRRADWIFEKVLGAGVKVISRPSSYDTFDPQSWWHDREQTKWLLMEYQKLAYTLIELARETEE
jgi:uncharacterized SAM-binding protein YcdF (DUF218 family)